MYTRVLAVAFFSTSVLGSILYSPVHDFDAMIKRSNELAKRQGYYPPPAGNCGPGATCQEACGPSWQQCPSNDKETWCFDSALSHCCPDGTGSKLALFLHITLLCKLKIRKILTNHARPLHDWLLLHHRRQEKHLLLP
jgi:hypothetical protein